MCGSKESIEGTAARGWPMLNSVLRGNAEQQLAAHRDTYVAALRAHGRGDADIAALLARWGVSRQIYVAPTDAQAHGGVGGVDGKQRAHLRTLLGLVLAETAAIEHDDGLGAGDRHDAADGDVLRLRLAGGIVVVNCMLFSITFA